MGAYDVKSIKDTIYGNSYVGRGIVIGKTRDCAKAVVAYFIMGRSVNSRNRVFVVDGETLATRAFDTSKLVDPSLVIYSAIRRYKNKLIVTNGDQTDTIYDYLENGSTFESALDTREFEPDPPIFTPRISGMLEFSKNDFSYKMNILKSADEIGSGCVRQNFSYPSIDKLGHFIHTYKCDGNPVPSFSGEPERVIIPDDIDSFTDEIWLNLDENNRVSLCTLYIDISSGKYDYRVVNRNK